MEVHHAKQSCYLEPAYDDSAICIGHRCIVGDISLGPHILHVVGRLTSEAEVSKTMTYVWRGEQEVTIGWAFRLLHAGLITSPLLKNLAGKMQKQCSSNKIGTLEY